MKCWTCPLAVAGLVAAGFIAGRSFQSTNDALAAQPDKKPAQPTTPTTPAGKPAAAPAGATDMKHMTPGAEHRVLDALVGTWEGGVKFWMAPDQSPMESTGIVKREWALDGHFVVEHVDGAAMGPDSPPFKGLGVVGYNTLDKKYESVWCENMATWMSTATGTFDSGKKTLTFSGDCIDPVTLKKSRTRHVIDLSNPTKQTMIGYGIGPDGKEFKNFEGIFTKK